MIVKLGDYNGNPTISGWKNEDDDYPVASIGARKLQGLLQLITHAPGDVVKFLNENGNAKGKEVAAEFAKKFNISTSNGQAKKKKVKVEADSDE